MKHITKLGALFDVLLILVVVFGVMLPGFAQDAPPVGEDDPSFTIVTGAVEFSASGEILVAGVVIAPASAFNPSGLAAGDLVIITGNLLPSGVLQAISLELFDDSEPDPEATPEMTPELTPEATLEVTPEATPELTPEATLEVTPELTPEATLPPDCTNLNHPIAIRIAETFGVSYEEVIALHCAGEGFGNIIRAYTLAEASTDGAIARDFIDRHNNGEGWGHILHESNVHPSDLAPGRVLKDQPDDSAATPAPQNNGNGNGNGGGNGNGNGNGGGNGNGNKP